MNKKLILITIFSWWTITGLAQSNVDALRYSMTSPLGSSARSMGLGGAIGAVGADPSVVLINPASLAQYKSGTFQFSLGMNKTGNEATYLQGGPQRGTVYNGQIPSINLVFTDRKMYKGEPTTKGWINYNFGVGWNRTADFNRSISYSGLNDQNSFLDGVADYVQGLDASLLDANSEQLSQGFYYFENMFWYGYLIDSISNGNYIGNYEGSAGTSQSGSIRSSGGIDEFNLSFAANYSHKLFFGFGLNFHSLRYNETNRFSEVHGATPNPSWSEYDFVRNLQTRGTGYSGRLGLVFLPNPQLRIGASLHTPTIFNLTDYYYDELNVNYPDASTEDMRTIDKEFSYTTTTPMKLGLQAAYIVGKTGLITGEIERVDYGTMAIYSDQAEFEGENNTIANKYGQATNIKLGGEIAMNEFRLRAGFAQLGNPFASSQQDFSRRFLNLGFGMHEKSWSLDVAVVNALGKDTYSPYTVAGNPVTGVNNEIGRSQIVLTIASKF